MFGGELWHQQVHQGGRCTRPRPHLYACLQPLAEFPAPVSLDLDGDGSCTHDQVVAAPCIAAPILLDDDGSLHSSTKETAISNCSRMGKHSATDLNKQQNEEAN